MPTITLPDGSQKEFNHPVTVMQVAESIGAGLAKATLAGDVNGRLVDASFVIENDAQLHLITGKDARAVEIIRHSTAHLLAQATKQLFPPAQVTIGPVIESGFYYDFGYERPFTPDDLVAIEARMRALAKQNTPVTYRCVSRDDAIAFFKNQGETYKVQLIEAIAEDEPIKLYTQGDFSDLCRGPHVPHLGHLKHFKLLKTAGAYWRGDSNNEMLHRIYGTAWLSKADLQHHLMCLQEAEKRDHRRLAKQLDLFHQQEEAPGMIFWHGKGWTVWQVVEQYIRKQQLTGGYQEIRTPQLVDQTLWARSGHADKYAEEMFITHSEKRDFAIKPMSCPCHVQVFNQGLKSYRDLPIRYAEFGCCHRNEPSGALHGLFRVRAMVQDDGHIFCTPAQITDEVAEFMRQAFKIYQDFGFDRTQIRICIATRPDKRIGSDADWDQSEQALIKALKVHNIDYQLLAGEGAFYGAKIELHLKDCLGREWQCGTMQVDFNMPQRLGAYYIADDGSKQVPVMLHRATLGSLERFIGILIEHYAGKFPLWLAPIQVVVMGITDKHIDYVKQIESSLRKNHFRVVADVRNEKIGFKIREHTLQKVPYFIIVGDKEMMSLKISIRTRSGDDLDTTVLNKFIAKLNEETTILARSNHTGGIEHIGQRKK